jgi:ubiquinone biosynthesis protein
MRLSSIPQFARDAKRLREIVGILGKYSLADWISRLDYHFVRSLVARFDGKGTTQLTTETRIRLAMSELGTTFIKLGQMLSTRSDLVGSSLAQELSSLQKGAPADPPAVVRGIIETELRRPIAELFAQFDETPIASASIGQVHRAVLPDGTAVVVKVQHPGIEARIHTDLDILATLADLAENNLPELAQYRPKATVAEFRRMLLRELDFGREERNLHEFAAHFAANQTVRFPRSYSQLSTSRVLTMEWLEGIPLADAESLRKAGHDLGDLARRGASIFLEMIFRDGFYHADPHPGNVLVLQGGIIGLIDCGMVGRLDETMREAVEDMLLAVAQGNADRLTTVIIQTGSVPPRLDQSALSADVADFVSYYAGRPLSKLHIGDALKEVVGIVRRYHIILPSPVAMLIKVLIMLEGTSKQLNPQFELIELIKPFQANLVRRRFSPRRRLAQLRRVYLEWENLARMLPRSLAEILQQVKGGQAEIHLEHKNLKSAVNRLVYGMLTSALFLGSSWMLSSKVPPAPGDVSIPGAIGCAVSFLQAMRLYWAIKNSGKLEE